jgi:hypothetical protein
MMIGTILAILNAVSLIFKDALLVSWRYVILAYVVEVLLSIIIIIIVAIIKLLVDKE